MKKSLNILLFISFVITTIMAPVTGIHIHKLAATVFLLLSMLHMVVYRKKLNCKRWLLLAIILKFFCQRIHQYVVESYDNLSGYPSDHFYCSGILFGCSYFCVS